MSVELHSREFQRLIIVSQQYWEATIYAKNHGPSIDCSVNYLEVAKQTQIPRLKNSATVEPISHGTPILYLFLTMTRSDNDFYEWVFSLIITNGGLVDQLSLPQYQTVKFQIAMMAIDMHETLWPGLFSSPLLTQEYWRLSSNNNSCPLFKASFFDDDDGSNRLHAKYMMPLAEKLDKRCSELVSKVTTSELNYHKSFGLSTAVNTELQKSFGLSTTVNTELQKSFGLSTTVNTELQKSFGLSTILAGQAAQNTRFLSCVMKHGCLETLQSMCRRSFDVNWFLFDTTIDASTMIGYRWTRNPEWQIDIYYARAVKMIEQVKEMQQWQSTVHRMVTQEIQGYFIPPLAQVIVEYFTWTPPPQGSCKIGSR